MPKQKTHKGSAKRFRVTARGKVLYAKSRKGHLMSHKSAKRKRQLSQPGQLTGAEATLVKHALGH